MDNLATKYSSYEDAILDISIYTKLLGKNMYSLTELRKFYFDEFRATHKKPSLLNKRYELSRLVSDDYRIRYIRELELKANESLVNLQQTTSRHKVNLDIPDSAYVSPDIKFTFSYENRNVQTDLESLIARYDIRTGEVIDSGVSEITKIVGSTQLDPSLEVEDTEEVQEEIEQVDTTYSIEEPSFSFEETDVEFQYEPETVDLQEEEPSMEDEEYEDDTEYEEDSEEYADEEYEEDADDVEYEEDEEDEEYEEDSEDDSEAIEYEDDEEYEEDVEYEEDSEDDVEYEEDSDDDVEYEDSADYKDESEKVADIISDIPSQKVEEIIEDEPELSITDSLFETDSSDNIKQESFVSSVESSKNKEELKEPEIFDDIEFEPPPSTVTSSSRQEVKQENIPVQQTGVFNREAEPTDLRAFLRKHNKCDIEFLEQYFTKKQINDALKIGKIIKKGNKIRLP